MKEAAYEERYCAYIDILGFTKLMGDLRSGTVKYETIRDLLRRIYEPFPKKIVDFEHCDFHAQSISDAVALSTKCTVPGLEMLFEAVGNSPRRHCTKATFFVALYARGACFTMKLQYLGKR